MGKTEIKNRVAHKIITNIFRILEDEASINIRINFNKNRIIGNGEHNFKDKQDIAVIIGCPTNFKNAYKDNGLFEKITLLDFSRMLITAFHEAQHIRQQESYYNLSKREKVYRKMAIQNVAACNNEYFYHADYSHNICEIDAEKYGIFNARAVLTELCGKDVADGLIRQYVKECINSAVHEPPYFGITYSDDVDEIINSFTDRFNEELEHKDIFAYGDTILKDYKKEDDVFYQHLINSEKNQKLYKYNKVTDGWKQLEMAVAINNRYARNQMPIEKGHILEKEPFLDYCDMCQLETEYGPQYFEQHKNLKSPDEILGIQKQKSVEEPNHTELRKLLDELAREAGGRKEVRKEGKNKEDDKDIR